MPNTLYYVNKTSGELLAAKDVDLTFAALKRNYRRKVVTTFTEPSMTKQSFASECDINNIMSKYQKSGLLTHVNKYQGSYADVSNAVDYHDALNIVLAGNEAFESLPSSLRKKFNNDPAEFLSFVDDAENADEMIKLGLRKQPEAPSGETINASAGADEAAQAVK